LAAPDTRTNKRTPTCTGRHGAAGQSANRRMVTGATSRSGRARPATSVLDKTTFLIEDAEEQLYLLYRSGRRRTTDEKIPSCNAPGFFVALPLGRPHEASRAAVPKKEHGSWWAERSRCAVLGGSTSLRLCDKVVGSSQSESDPNSVQLSIPSQSRQIPSHPVPQKCSHRIRHAQAGKAEPHQH
jgi:hypothetical protein